MQIIERNREYWEVLTTQGDARIGYLVLEDVCVAENHGKHWVYKEEYGWSGGYTFVNLMQIATKLRELTTRIEQ